MQSDNSKTDKIKKLMVHRPLGLLTGVFLLALVVLCILSLRQYQQLQEVKRDSDQKRCDQLQFSHQLVNQLSELVGQYNRGEEIVSQLSSGVCLIQGEYMFVDPVSQLPLRYIVDESDRVNQTAGQEVRANAVEISPEQNEENLLPVCVDGKGPLWRVQYTATGFLVDGRGYILTNKHVTEPWQVAREYKHVLEAGYEGKLCLFRAFFPGRAEPFELQVEATSEQEDIALLYCDLGGEKIPVLPCETEPGTLRAGQTVIVLGYPTGFDALLARLGQEELDEIVEAGVSFDEMARSMARRGLVEPTGTRGMCGRTNAERIVYDAQTAIGGSGGPVLGPRGKVVGINTALLRGFSGASFGIPIQRGLMMLDEVLTSERQTGTAQVAGDLSGM
jgi:S1-C subfamily serine protease